MTARWENDTAKRSKPYPPGTREFPLCLVFSVWVFKEKGDLYEGKKLKKVSDT